MKNCKNKAKKLLLLIITSCILFSGCSFQKPDPIVIINDKSLYLKDFLYDIYLIETEGNQLEDFYQDNFSCSYWDYKYQDTSMREAAKNSIIASVVMYELLSDQAIQHGINLNQTDLTKVNDEINSIFTDPSAKSLIDEGLNDEVLETSYVKHLLADKYRDYLSKDYKIDDNSIRKSINSETYREYKTECLFIPAVLMEDNTISPLSEGEKAAAYNTITIVREKLFDGMGFDILLNTYQSLSYDTRDFVYGDNGLEKEYQDASRKLAKDEYSPIVTTDYGYYIIHMLDNNSNDRYEQAVDDLMKAEEEKKFTNYYNTLKEQYDITINFDNWDKVTIGSITIPKN